MKPEQKTGSGRAPERSRRRPYVKPAFITTAAFERQALSCAGCLNLSPNPPAFCALKS